MQEVVLVFAGRQGVVVVFFMFGAGGFGSRRSLPKGFRNDHSVGQRRQRVRLFCPEMGLWGANNEPESAQLECRSDVAKRRVRALNTATSRRCVTAPA